jgi:hypothetical protein
LHRIDQVRLIPPMLCSTTNETLAIEILLAQA